MFLLAFVTACFSKLSISILSVDDQVVHAMLEFQVEPWEVLGFCEV